MEGMDLVSGGRELRSRSRSTNGGVGWGGGGELEIAALL
jgi:hypothetical protein